MQKHILTTIFGLFLVFAFCLGSSSPVAADGYSCEIVDTNGTTVIGQFAELGTALNNINANQTIRLLNDVTYNSYIYVSSKSFSIDINGHQLTVNSNDSYGLGANGYTLRVKDAAGGGSVTVNAAMGLRADYNNSNVIIEAPLTVNATGKGIYTYAGGAVSVSNATINAEQNALEAYGKGHGIPSSITVTGNVTCTGLGYYGVYAYEGGVINVTGNISATNYGYGAYIQSGEFSVTGNVTAESYGVTLYGGKVEVRGDVTSTGSYGCGIMAINGELDVEGNVRGDYLGVYAESGVIDITVSGSVAAVGTPSVGYPAMAVSATGNQITVAIGGSATATANNAIGVHANNGSKISIGGNVNAKGGLGVGVDVGAGSEVTVDGRINASFYIKSNSASLQPTDNTTPTTKDGYLSYLRGTPVNSVWVKNLTAAFAWAVRDLQFSAFAKGPATLMLPDALLHPLYQTVESGFSLSGADYVDGQLYGVSLKSLGFSNLYQIDDQTGDMDLVATTQAALNGFTYDRQRQTAYAIGGDDDGFVLYEIDLDDGSLTEVMTGSHTVRGLTSDNQGRLYGVDTSAGTLLRFDPNGKTVTEITLSGVDLSYTRAIACDRDNGIIYGTFYNGASQLAGVYTIDTDTGAAPLLSSIPWQLDAVAFPYVKELPPFITVTTQPAAEKTVTKGSNSDTLSCTATVSDDSAPAYAWYTCDDEHKTGATPLTTSTYPTAHSAELTIPTSLPTGSYYYFCRVSANGAESIDSSVVKVNLVDQSFTITASADSHGAISPSGSVSVTEHNSRSFTMAPDYGYIIADVLVDGVSVGAVSSYTFSNVTANHTIAVSFVHNCLAKQFKDVDITKWYHEGIDFVLLEGLFKGLSDTAFAPDATMTRAMLVTVLYRLEGEPATLAANPFHDVVDNQWYTKAVIWAADKNIVKGYNAATFGTNDPITREQMATLLYRYAQYKGYDLSAGNNYDLLTFSDGAEVSSYATAAMKWACGEGILQGDNNKLRPGENSTRAQVATMLMRFVKSNVE